MTSFCTASRMLIFCLLLMSLLCSCDNDEQVKKISFQEVEPEKPLTTLRENNTLVVAVSAMISPKETMIYYQNLLDYLGKKLGRPLQLIQRETYAEINDLIKKEELDLAFVCTGAYIEGHEAFGMELLVAPVAYGNTVYFSYIIVPRDSTANSLADLKGKRFAFTDPLSNTGKLAPSYMLARMGTTAESFFSTPIYTYSHDKSIEAVAQHLVDGAAVDSLVWEYLHARNPRWTAGTRIIERSEPYGIPPLVVPRGMAPELKKELKDFFLHVHEEEKGKQILSEIMIDRFVEIDDAIYEPVRTMKRWLDEHANQ